MKDLDYQNIGKLVISKLKQQNGMCLYRHLENLSSIPTFSNDKKFRYLLEIGHKQNKGKTVCVIMKNPSYANQFIADKSVSFLEKLIFQKKIQKFNQISKIVIVNLYSRIQTRDFSASTESIGSKNDIYIRKAIEESNIILRAWGVCENNERVQKIEDMVKGFPNKILYKTKKHPAVGSYSESFIKKWEMN